MKNIQKFFLIGVAVSVFGLSTYFGTEYILKDKAVEFNIPGAETSVGNKGNNNQNANSENLDGISFYRLSPEGEIIKEELKLQGENRLTVLLEYVFKSYGEYPENPVIQMPNTVKVLGYETKMGTLYINMSKELVEAKMADKKVEDGFMDTLGSTLYQFSKSMGFQDFQILVEGQAESRIFDVIQTDTPRLVFP